MKSRNNSQEESPGFSRGEDVNVSEGCQQKTHQSTIKLLRKYEAEFKRFGKLDFKSDLNTQGSLFKP